MCRWGTFRTAKHHLISFPKRAKRSAKNCLTCLLKPYYNTNFFKLQLFTTSCSLPAPKAQAVCLCDASETANLLKTRVKNLIPWRSPPCLAGVGGYGCDFWLAPWCQCCRMVSSRSGLLRRAQQRSRLKGIELRRMRCVGGN